MIITKTPLRLSLLGGGSDFPAWFKEHGGIVLGGSVNKYVYITARFLPPFHAFRHRLMYREVESVSNIEDIRHPVFRACMADWPTSGPGLEVSHLSDLPGRSGTGSSSSFVVGLINALGALRGKLLLPHELTEQAIRIERDVLKEAVGCQDQTWAAHGGVNIIRFCRDGDVSVQPMVLSHEHLWELEGYLMLFFTRIERTSSDVASAYTFGERGMHSMARIAEDGVRAVYARDWEKLGNLIDQSWRIKCGLSDRVTNDQVNQLYSRARLAGALGGKLTGAGGGGCLLLVVPPKSRYKVIQALPDAVHIPFRFEREGSKVIFCDPANIKQYRN